jgi:hypothetical protein
MADPIRQKKEREKKKIILIQTKKTHKKANRK